MGSISVSELLLNNQVAPQYQLEVKGTITRLKQGKSLTNILYVSYYISDETSEIRATKFSPPEMQCKVGDTIVVHGIVKYYHGTPYIDVKELHLVESVIDSPPQKLSISYIRNHISEVHLENFHRKNNKNRIQVDGIITLVQRKVSKIGNEYYSYRISDGLEELAITNFQINTFSDLQVGQQVSIIGFLEIIDSNPFINLESAEILQEDASTEFQFSAAELETLEEENLVTSEESQMFNTVDSIVQLAVSEFEDLDIEPFTAAVNTSSPEVDSELLPLSGFQILINEDLLTKIEKMHQEDKKRLHKSLRDLQAGYWQSGIKVKKLRGIQETVYEARLDRSRRILFQIRSVPARDQNLMLPSLIIQDIVRHKHINSEANNIRKIQIERLNLQNYNAHLVGNSIQETEITSIEELDIAATPLLSSIFSKKPLLTSDEANTTGLPNGIKYYRFDSPIRNEWIEKDTTKRILALSPFQQHLVYSYPPLLINGGAGTGKTTVLAHIFVYLWEQKNHPTLYITLTRSLQKFISEIISNMTNFDRTILNGVITFNELCRKIIGSSTNKFPKDSEHTLLDFIEWMNKHPQYSVYDTLMIWQEYYGIIKGSCHSYTQSLIPLKAYLAKGKKVSLFSVDQREKIYTIAKNYNLYLRENNYWDILDLAQFTLESINSNKDLEQKIQMNGIICDEIQDFVDVQYSLFNRLLPKGFASNLYFGGDSQQTINSSNFRWEDLRVFLYNALNYKSKNIQMKNIEYMNRNFRSTTKMINIANRFIELKTELGLRDYKDQLQSGIEDFDVKHKPGLLLNASKEELQAVFQEVSGAYRIIIVYSNSNKEPLRKYFKEHLIFTVEESKGMEFLATFLYNLGSDSGLDWRKLIENEKSDYIDKNSLLIKYVFNRIYVAITRARRHLIVYEEDQYAKKFWKMLLSPAFKNATNDIIMRIWSELTSKEENLAIANYFFTNEKYELAADYYRQASAMNKYNESLARAARQNKKYKRSTRIFLNLRMYEEAAKDFEQFDFKKAIKYYKKIKDENGITRCKAKIAQQKQHYSEAAKLFAQIENFDEAANCYQLAGNIRLKHKYLALMYEFYSEWRKAATEWRKGGFKDESNTAQLKHYELSENYHEAAKLAEQLEVWDKASEFWLKVGEEHQSKICAANNYELHGEFQAADKIFEELDLLDRRIQLWENVQQYDKVAELWEDAANRDSSNSKLWQNASLAWIKHDNLNAALSAVSHTTNYSLQAEILGKLKRFSAAAILCESNQLWNSAGSYWISAGKWENAVHAYERTKNWEQAAFCYEQLSNWDAAGESYFKAENWIKAKECLSQTDQWDSLAEVYEHLNEWPAAAECWININKWSKAAKAFEKVELWEKAGIYWEKAGNWKKAAQAYTEAKQYQNAGDAWNHLQNYSKVAECYSQITPVTKESATATAQAWESANKHSQAAITYESVENWTSAIRIWENLGKWSEVARCSENNGDWQYAAKNWLKVNNKYKAAEAYEQNKDWQKAAEIWESVSEWKNAAKMYLKVGNKESAAKQYAKMKKYDLAGKYFSEAGDDYFSEGNTIKAKNLWKKALGDYRRSKQYAEGATTAEKLENWKKAAENWEKSGHYKKALTNRLKMEISKELAVCYQYLDMWEECGSTWQTLANKSNNKTYWRNAGLAYSKLPDIDTAIKCYTNAKDYEKVGELYAIDERLDLALKFYNKTTNYQKIAELYEQQDNLNFALEYYDKCNNHAKCAEIYLDRNDTINAADRFFKAKDYKKCAPLYEQNEDWVHAALSWEEEKDYKKASIAWITSLSKWKEQHPDITVFYPENKSKSTSDDINVQERLAECHEALGEWKKAAKIWDLLHMWDKAGHAYQRAKSYGNAIKAFEASGNKTAKQKAINLQQRNLKKNKKKKKKRNKRK